MVPSCKTTILFEGGAFVRCFEWRDTIMRKILNGKCMIAGYETRGWIEIRTEHEVYPEGVISNVQIAKIAAVVPMRVKPEDYE
jgi:hypothetical protein